jgi:hypothetical protein
MSHLICPLTLTALTCGRVRTLIFLAAALLICPFGTFIILGLSAGVLLDTNIVEQRTTRGFKTFTPAQELIASNGYERFEIWSSKCAGSGSIQTRCPRLSPKPFFFSSSMSFSQRFTPSSLCEIQEV